MKAKAKTKGRIALIAAAVLAIAVALAFVGLWYFWDRAQNTERDPNGVAEALAYEDTELTGIDWDYWLSVNPDIVGWIYIPDTDIDYPIVHASEDNPDYYLTHDVYRTYNPMGAIYLDASSEGLFEGGNAVIFGHHWSGSTGTMFADMANYSNYSWAAEHSVIYIITPDDTVHAINVQGADIVRGSSAIKRTEFSDQADLMAYWEERFEACDMKLAAEAEETDQLFTFVTCSYNFWVENERTLTYGVEDAETRDEPLVADADDESTDDESK